ncbi:MAG TPA: hypothetical protein VGY48_29095 [Vicinamibacterales bacterium]|nr:hypothetical protein [Vicinamibacterales bacterium]
MRIRVIQTARPSCIDGIRLDGFEVGREYEVGNTVAALFLAEGWAEPVPLPDLAMLILEPRMQCTDDPPNLIRERVHRFLRSVDPATHV